MIKSLYTFLLLGLCSGMLAAQDEVTVYMNVPAEVTAGQEFLVEVDIEKGALEEFSRFQQELPAGFTAVQGNSGSADFSFDNQRVRFIWLKLPAQEQVTISFRIKVHERLKGTLGLFGEFSYVENNERKSIVIDQKSIEILPNPDVPAEQQVAVADFAGILASEKAAMASTLNVTAIRQTPYRAGSGEDIMVNLLVYKKNMNKFAKIEEQIPRGYEARSMESGEGLFTFKDGVAKFVWMNLPELPGFRISYRLIPVEGSGSGPVKINGVLSYIQDGRNIEVDIIEQDIDLDGVTAENMEAVVKAVHRGTAVPLADTKPEETKVVKPERDPPPPPPPPRKETKSGIPASQQLPVSDGVYFRVQLAANRTFRDIDDAFEAYKLSRPVLCEEHQGYYKYTAGSFPTYGQAQAFKNNAVSGGYPGAFIIAYRNGKRIDIMQAVQESGGK